MRCADLDVAGLTVRFGGHTAVDALSLRAPQGRITGLIGPNGAGKTTTFNACTGLLQPTEGTVHMGGLDVTTKRPEQRARLGLGRTFQRMQLYDSVSVRENVELGLEARLAGGRPWRQLFAPRREMDEVRRRAADALELCGIADLADRAVSGLPTGQRRLVELARTVAGGFDLMLLDEPSSGLDPSETGSFGDVLRTLVSERGIGILLVEHDMSLVMTCCEHIYVIDFGELVFEGSATETQSSEIVRDAYLGASA